MEMVGPKLKAVHFALFSPSEIVKLAVMEVTTPLGLNPLGHPLPGGLYDLRMGPCAEQSGPCHTCQAVFKNCPGHFGYIRLPLPVVNPLFHHALFGILRISCSSCHRLLIPGHAKALFVAQMKLLDFGMVTEALKLEEMVMPMRDDNAPSESMELLVNERLAEYMDQLELSPGKEWLADTSLLESLRGQFTNNVLNQKAKGKSCCFCKAPQKTITMYANRLIIPVVNTESTPAKKGEKPGTGKSSTFMLPTDSQAALRAIFREEKEVLLTLYPVLKDAVLEHPTDLFFMEALLVPPPKVRPLNFLGGKVVEPMKTTQYKKIIHDCTVLRHIQIILKNGQLPSEAEKFVTTVYGDSHLDKLNTVWADLQNDVNHVLDTDMGNPSKSNKIGLKQVIEKKEGLLRMNMMGKRVNFAARSVITPDPNIGVEEIGIPQIFAKKLTYPEKFNGNNFEHLKKLIENGPDVYPGANLVETSKGSVIKLFGGDSNRKKREGVAKLLLQSGEDETKGSVGCKIVHRHLLTGDMLLLNRQPTLHRPSIMAHKARVLPSQKTLRLHYSNCKSYNADFDGDEMNAHCAQNELARSEAANVVNVPNQYLVPKDGTPLGGLIQDHVIAGVHLTVRGKMLSKEDYQQLVYQGLSTVQGDIKLLPPAMIKPRRLWTGKQVISTILLNIIPSDKHPLYLDSHSKTSLKSWEVHPPRPWKAGGTPFRDPRTMSEAEVIIQKGMLVCGVLDKQHFGATQYSLTHCLYELYGGECSTKLLNSLGRLFTYHLQFLGFTIGVEDILVKKKPDQERKKIIHKLRKIGDIAASSALELDTPPADLAERLEAAYYADRDFFRAKLDSAYKKALDEYTNNINKTVLPVGLVSSFPKNNLQLMVVAGAKGSTVNTMQISCLLGQIELEGKRPPLMLSGRSLPCFRPFETIPKAGGFIDGRFMTGIQPQDFFFHCMAGREGLIDTAVKTSRSGYLQRCLIKHLEGLSVAYDHTVRNHDGSVVQFAYGEDGMEVGKAVFLKPELMNFLYHNRKCILDKEIVKKLKDKETSQKINEIKSSINSWKHQVGRDRPRAAFTIFSEEMRGSVKEKHFTSVSAKTGRPKAYKKLLKKWRNLEDKDKTADVTRCPDPATGVYRSHSDFGAISESLEAILDDYLRSQPHISKRRRTDLQDLIALKSMSGLCPAGEPVGLLAAQSVGEPSTQMTLNTFHFAGRGDMNVTLGIPRLREILMTASKSMKTPSMDIPLLPTENAEKLAERLQRGLQRVTIADVVEDIHVTERLETSPEQVFTYKVRVNFLPRKCYKKMFVVKPETILRHMEKQFMVNLSKTIRALGKKYGELIHESQEEKRATQGVEGDEDDVAVIDTIEPEMNNKDKADEESSDDDAGDDGDAGTARRKDRHLEAREYDEETDVEDMIDSDAEDGNEESNANGDASGGEEVDDERMEALRESAKEREMAVLQTFPMIRAYSFDIEKQQWCEMVVGVPVSLCRVDFSGILREICEGCVVHQVKGIRRAIVYKTNRGEVALKTEGINIQEISRHDRQLNLHRLYCNDVHMMAKTYGIEAAGRVIVKELQSVFSVYGITVDPRHLLLIADYMTMQGVYLPLNRTGMANNGSALLQMSFESAVSFLRKALLRGRYDVLGSPSAKVMVGRPMNAGTGAFSLHYTSKVK